MSAFSRNFAVNVILRLVLKMTLLYCVACLRRGCCYLIACREGNTGDMGRGDSGGGGGPLIHRFCASVMYPNAGGVGSGALL